MARTDTRQRLLDAAITLVARGGMRALSHRALENEAGVSRGSTTYHLGTSHQIVEALLERLAELDAAAISDALGRLAIAQLAAPVTGEEPTTDAAVRLVTSALLVAPERALARYTLMIEAARDESLRPVIRRWRDEFAAIPAPMLARLGAEAPEDAARDMVALMDGIIFEHLSTGRSGLEDRLAATVADYVRRLTSEPRPEGG